MMVSIQLSAVDWACFALLIVGAINWGLVGLVEMNLLETVMAAIFQEAAAELVLRTIYAFIGLAGIYFFYPLYRISQQRRSRLSSLVTN